MSSAYRRSVAMVLLVACAFGVFADAAYAADPDEGAGDSVSKTPDVNVEETEKPETPDANFEGNESIVAPLIYGGGSITNPGWIAAIYDTGSYICTGSLIHQSWILTAAHCVDVPADYSVRVGSASRSTGGVTRTISAIRIHPSWNPSVPLGSTTDLALLRLSTPITGVTLPRLATVGTWPYIDQVLAVAGWGQYYDESPASQYLQGAPMLVDSNSEGWLYEDFCERTILGQSNYDYFCFGLFDAEACPGDSGGPLYGFRSPTSSSGPHDMIYGVVSFGISRGGPYCGHDLDLDDYAQRVSSHNTWIASVMQMPGDEMLFYRSNGQYAVYDVGSNGTLATPALQSGSDYAAGWTSISAIDLDGDGIDELLFYRADGAYEYRRVNPDGSLGGVVRSGTDYTKNWASITAVDLNGDGMDELMFYRKDGLFRFYRTRPDGSVGSPLAAGSNYTKNWTSIVALDLDGNGKDELFFYRSDGLFRFYRPRPDGSVPAAFQAGSNYTSGWTSITGVDLNGDDKDEMFFYRTDGLYRFYRPRADGSLPSAIAAGNDYETGWTSITGVNIDGH